MPDRFVVPQFIDAEDKILGPITVRQFLICLSATFILFLEYKILQFGYFVVALIPTAGLASVFAFMKVNGHPFHVFFLNVLQTYMRPTLRVWHKEKTNAELRAFFASSSQKPLVTPPTQKTRPASTRLRDLALTVNTGGVFNPEDET